MSSKRTADLIVERYGLWPPVDIRSLLSDVADDVELPWSYNCDGLLYRFSTSKRPQVFIKSNQPQNRRRFTEAHEFGHIKIPWHIESISCHIDETSTHHAYNSEREANEFASRILVPRPFLRGLIDSSEDVKGWIEALEVCEVSAHASIIALANQLTSGYRFAIEDAANGRPIVVSSSGSQAAAEPETLLDLRKLETQAQDHGRVELRGKYIRWYRYVDNTPPSHSDSRSSSEILTSLLQKHGHQLSDGRSRQNSLSGIIGGKLKDRDRMSVGTMLGLLKYQFGTHPDWEPMLEDPEFVVYLEKRVLDLYERDMAKARKTS